MTFPRQLLLAAFGAAYTFTAQAADLAAQRDAVVAYYKAHNDAFVEDAAWTSTTLFNVGVHYMGERADGVAVSVCEVLREHGVSQRTRVRVIDINTMGMDPKRWEVVGEARC